MNLLECHELCKTYRGGTRAEVRALDGVSMSIAAASFTVITGPSGCGKTTLLALLAALERPTRGEVRFDGTDLTASSDFELTRVRRRLGFVFQSFALIPRLSVWENVAYPLIPRGVPRAERCRRAEELLARLGLADKIAGRLEELSGGEQQRVAIARALAGRPDVLIADEPTSNLDPQAAETLTAILCQLHTQGMTLLIASHDPHLIATATQHFQLTVGRLIGERRGLSPPILPPG